jgi:hypothetical protein
MMYNHIIIVAMILLIIVILVIIMGNKDSKSTNNTSIINVEDIYIKNVTSSSVAEYMSNLSLIPLKSIAIVKTNNRLLNKGMELTSLLNENKSNNQITTFLNTLRNTPVNRNEKGLLFLCNNKGTNRIQFIAISAIQENTAISVLDEELTVDEVYNTVKLYYNKLSSEYSDYKLIILNGPNIDEEYSEIDLSEPIQEDFTALDESITINSKQPLEKVSKFIPNVNSVNTALPLDENQNTDPNYDETNRFQTYKKYVDNPNPDINRYIRKTG